MEETSAENVSKNEPQPKTSSVLIKNPPQAFQLSSVEDDSEIMALEPDIKYLQVPGNLPTIVEVPEAHSRTNMYPKQDRTPDFQSLQSETSYEITGKFLTALMIVLTGILVIKVLLLLLVRWQQKL